MNGRVLLDLVSAAVVIVCAGHAGWYLRGLVDDVRGLYR